jgi:hypothetical protein
MNGESVVSASQILVKQQGVKQQNETNHGVGRKVVKLWYIAKEVVGI